MSGLRFIAGLIGVLGACFGTQALAEEVAGKVVNVVGKVLVRNGDASKPEMRFLKVGDSIQRGTIINSGSNSSVKVLMSDKTILDLGPSTLFKVDEYQLKGGSDRNVQLSMDYGKVRASVNTPVGNAGRFNIKTRAATMGVRGTEFIVKSDMDLKSGKQGSSTGQTAGTRTEVTVLEGKVAVISAPKVDRSASAPAAAPPALLTAGNQLTTSVSLEGAGRGLASEAPQVTQLSAEQMKSEVSSVKPPDSMAFTQAISVNTDSSSGGGGKATLIALAERIDVAIDPKTTDGGATVRVPGAILPQNAINDNRFNDLNSMRANLRVIVFKK